MPRSRRSGRGRNAETSACEHGGREGSVRQDPQPYGGRRGRGPSMSGSSAARSPLFHRIPPDLVAALLADGVPMIFRRGEFVFRAGEIAAFGYLVETGKIGMGRATSSGRRQLMTLFVPGDPFGLTSVFDRTARVTDGVALSDAEVLGLPAARLREWVLSDVRIGAATTRFLSVQIRRINKTVGQLLNPDVGARVAASVLELAERIGVRGPYGVRVRHDLTQEQWAQHVGASREAVNKALTDMARLGIIVLESRELVVLDEQRMRRKALS
jgi:CRP/FNR family transcriptional regulator, cyclic AMP receptor protein